jgi:membrane protease subunit HflK
LARSDGEDHGTDQKIKRGAARTIGNGLLALISLGVIGGWVSTGFYSLGLGEEAIILRLGEHHRTVMREGLNWHWPEPLEYDTRVNTSGLRTEIFGIRNLDPAKKDGHVLEGILIQTADSNIVSVSFELQYTVDDPYSYVYGMARPRRTLYEATQAALREVIGGRKVDAVLFQRRQEIEAQAQVILEETLLSYVSERGGAAAFTIDRLNLQTVHPPDEVRAAFEDVVAAQQDEVRSVSKATGDSREIIERATAEASELHEGSQAYKESVILESRGTANRFEALLVEYNRAPVVTRQRLYLETMESIMPGVEKMIIEPDTVSVMPFVPGRTPSVSAPPAGGTPHSAPPSAPQAAEKGASK